MKKIILTTIIAVSCAFSSLFAFSWSGIVDNGTRFSTNHDFSEKFLNQSNGVHLAVNSHLNESGSFRFAGEGLYRFKLNLDLKRNDSDIKQIADCTLAKFSFDLPMDGASCNVSLGRFKYSDYSGSVFSQTSDGAYVSYDTLKFKASAYVGYTGFLNRLNVSMVENEYKKNDQFYALCPKYIPLLADFSYKALFESQTIGLQAVYFQPVTDDNTQKAYGTVSLNGPIGNVAAYAAKVTLGTEKFENLMLDAKLDADYYINTKAKISAGAEYVSGEQGDIKPFVTISGRSFGTAPVYNGVIVPKFGLAFASGNFYAAAVERIVITMPKDEAKLNGFDTSINVVYNVFSDLQIGCDAGAYICKEVKELSNYYATLNAKLAF